MRRPRSTELLRRTCAALSLAVLVASLGACEQEEAGSHELVSVRLPTASGTAEPAADQAPLTQTVELQFRGRPASTLIDEPLVRIVDTKGRRVAGELSVAGASMTFSPALPTSVEGESGALIPNPDGLQPEETYTVWLDQGRLKLPASLLAATPAEADGSRAVAQFRTGSTRESFLDGLPSGSPRLVQVSPADGSQQVSPHLATDPEARFPSPQPFTLTFDAPVHPAELDRFTLVDLDDQARALPSVAHLEVQSAHRAVVQVLPTGPLPLGHMISVEYPVLLAGLGSSPDREAIDREARRVASVVTIAARLPHVRDAQVESFDDLAGRADDDATGAPDLVAAEWNAGGAGLLAPSFAVGGDGLLGRFIPNGSNPHTITLDTDSQAFPLPDGSTPDAPNLVIHGGRFPFTSIRIPDGITLTATGRNALVLQATGTCQIGGVVDLSGDDGLNEMAFDSAITSIPGGRGGAGGGRGGVGHPLRYLPGQQGNVNALVDPEFGGIGFGPGNRRKNGGTGGQCGMLDHPDANGNYTTDSEIVASELSNAHNNGFKMPGGGGGSMRTAGTAPQQNGHGNVIATLPGQYLVRTPADGPDFDVLRGGKPGDVLFGDGNPGNDFLGGEIAGYAGGEGGGGGASALDSYYNGNWCKTDADPTNDAVCTSEFGNPPVFADSIGDSRGGSGGGGGGAFVVECLHDIQVLATAVIDCRGGNGGGGEFLGCSNWAGSGGGGAGGAIVLRAGGQVNVDPGAVLDVNGGRGARATSDTGYITSCRNMSRSNPGAGGDGGDGLIQLDLMDGAFASVSGHAELTGGAWVDPGNRLNPVQLARASFATSRWRDLGHAGRDDDGPFLHVRGLDPEGQVPTDGSGRVLDAALADFRVHFAGVKDPRRADHYLPGLEPRDHWVPPGTAIRVEFQGARAIAEGSREVDPDSRTAWSADPAVADGLRFVRFRVHFDLAVDGGEVTPQTPRPALDFLRLSVEY